MENERARNRRKGDVRNKGEKRETTVHETERGGTMGGMEFETRRLVISGVY